MSVHAVGSFALDRNGGSPDQKGPELLSEQALAGRQSVASRRGPPVILVFAGWLRKCHGESHSS